MIKLTVKLCLANRIDYCKPMQCNPFVKIQFYNQKSDYQHRFIPFPTIFAWFSLRKVIRDFLVGWKITWLTLLILWSKTLKSAAWHSFAVSPAICHTFLLSPLSSAMLTNWTGRVAGLDVSSVVVSGRRGQLDLTGWLWWPVLYRKYPVTGETWWHYITTSPPRLIVPSHWGSDPVQFPTNMTGGGEDWLSDRGLVLSADTHLWINSARWKPLCIEGYA